MLGGGSECGIVTLQNQNTSGNVVLVENDDASHQSLKAQR